MINNVQNPIYIIFAIHKCTTCTRLASYYGNHYFTATTY